MILSFPCVRKMLLTTREHSYLIRWSQRLISCWMIRWSSQDQVQQEFVCFLIAEWLQDDKRRYKRDKSNVNICRIAELWNDGKEKKLVATTIKRREWYFLCLCCFCLSSVKSRGSYASSLMVASKWSSIRNGPYSFYTDN